MFYKDKQSSMNIMLIPGSLISSLFVSTSGLEEDQ